MKYYVTNADVKFEERHAELCPHENAEMNLVKVYPYIKKQRLEGFGGAATEASAYVWSRMSRERQEELLELYFGSSGNRNQLCRLPIQSCDFSLGNRAYVEEGDAALATFSIREDEKYQIPFLQAALKKNPDLQFMAAPWSPPAFMKSNKEMNHGGRLLEEYSAAWAKLMTNYLLAYRAHGIVINRISVQNEPAAIQTWDSCQYSAKEEGAFAVRFLRRALDDAGLSQVRIFIWDHNKDQMLERCAQTFAVEGALEAVAGIAFHWYSGDHFEALQQVREQYPDKELMFTEGCVEYSRFAGAGQTANAEMYAHDIIGNLKSGMNGFMDWNLILDSQGGPNHVGNFCDAPVMCSPETDRIDVKLSYYYLGHFSRYLVPGARRLLVSSWHKNLESTAFENPDGTITAVILNASDEDMEFELWMEGAGAWITLEAHSIMTAMLTAQS